MKKLGFVLFSMVAIALICSGRALAQNVGDDSVYFVAYYANNVSAAPDATVRVINDGSAGAFGGGDLYAGFYVFDEIRTGLAAIEAELESTAGDKPKRAPR